MKLPMAAFWLLLPTTIFAQPPHGMGEKEMQDMMQQMQQMQTCMQSIDQSKLKDLEESSNQFEADIKAACAQGNRDDAQKKAIAFAEGMLTNPEIIKIRKCTEPMQGMMPGMMQEMPYELNIDDYKNQHVCDQ